LAGISGYFCGQFYRRAEGQEGPANHLGSGARCDLHAGAAPFSRLARGETEEKGKEIEVRKASDKTQLRYTKARLRNTERWAGSLQAEIRNRRRVGAMLANVAFNLARRDGVEPELRAVLDECRTAWDAIASAPLEDPRPR
jgi:hypothetical protein